MSRFNSGSSLIKPLNIGVAALMATIPARGSIVSLSDITDNYHKPLLTYDWYEVRRRIRNDAAEAGVSH